MIIYHANPKGTGSALEITKMCSEDFTAETSIVLAFYKQMTVGYRPLGIKPQFDIANGLGFVLGFDEVAKILQVLRGECETIHDGRGLYDDERKQVLRFAHIVDPVSVYTVEITRGDERIRFLLSTSEALGLCEAFALILKEIVFGEGN